MENKKDKTLAIVLAICLGVYGAHWFYLGDKKRAWWYLGVTLGGLVLSWLILPAFAPLVIWVFAIIDLIKLIQMSDEEFNEKYNAVKPAE